MDETVRATEFTIAANDAVLQNPNLNWEDRQDFDFASRGLITRGSEDAIYSASGELVWHHTSFEEMLKGDAPRTVNPSLWRHALLNNFRGLFKVTDGIYQVRGESLGNITFVEGKTGYIVIDPLTTVETASYALNLLYKNVGVKPIVAVIYSHSHSDHFGGVKGIISEEDVSSGKVHIFAPEGFLEWVLKEQGLVAEGMPARNDYMYGENLKVSPLGLVDTGLGQAIEGGQVTFIAPTESIPNDGKTILIDGVEVQMKFAPGEAPVGMHCFFPVKRTLHIADNCYMCMHNIYTIRGAFPRDAMQWAESVSKSLKFEPTEFLISGHNWPVFGSKTIKLFLENQRDGIKYMHDQTVRYMSHGFVPSEIANKISFPPSLDRLWHLRGYYGSLKHNVQGIYSYYLGWYDGNPANLDLLPPRELAKKTVEYMGGVDLVIKKAQADYDSGNYRWVVYVLDKVIWIEPENRKAKKIAALAHTQLGYQCENATWRNAYLSAAQELTKGLPKKIKNHRNLRDVMKGMDSLLILNSLSIRVNGPKVIGDEFTINWILKDTEKSFHSVLRNSVLNNGIGGLLKFDVSVELKRDTLSLLALAEIDWDDFIICDVVITGNKDKLRNFIYKLDEFSTSFPISSHELKFDELKD